MANPTLLVTPLAINGEKNTIPAVQATMGDGLFNQSTGFPTENSIPTINGGKNIKREDMNGVFYLLSNILFQVQKGKVFEWDVNQSYFTPAIVMDSGTLYFCIKDVAIGGMRPINDSAFEYWVRLQDYIYERMTIKYSDIIGVPTKLSQFSNADTDFQSGAQVTTVVNTSASNINTRIDNEVNTLNSKIDTNYSTLDDKIDTQISNVNTKFDNEVATLNTAVNTLNSNIGTINSKIPEQATSTNQLADKEFVNSSIQTQTANFRGSWETWAAVPTNASSYPVDYAGKRTPTSNDYLVVISANDYPVGEGKEALKGTWRFKYTGVWATNNKSGWMPEYQINREPLTEAQIKAINSGITTEFVVQITTNQNNIATNTADITVNTANIATNTANIAANTTNIATNTANITTNTNNIATNTADIATNRTNIEALQQVSANLKPVATEGTYESLLTHYELPIATQAILGGVKQGGGTIIDADGTIRMDTTTVIEAIDWTQLNTSEKLHNNGSSGIINLINGRVQITTATTIQMPVPLPNCATWVSLWCTSGSVTFDTTYAPVYFEDGNTPPAGNGVFVYTLASIGGNAWYCMFTGRYLVE